MFYTPDALRRGGRFYQCWIADAWPHRFASIPERQLVAVNIPQICDELLEVIMTESGAPRRRFSLRLSIRLIRGLARIYRRQCNIVLKDLCMMDAKVMRFINQREAERRARVRDGRRGAGRARPVRPLAAAVTLPDQQAKEGEPDEAGRPFVVDEQSITLREEPLPLPAPCPLDGFGEEPADQLLRDIETMLGPERGELMDDATPAPVSRRPSRSTRLTAPPAELAMSEVTRLGDTAHMLDVTNILDRDMTALQVPDAPVPPPASPTVPAQEPPVRETVPPQPPCDLAESLELLELEKGAPARRRGRRLAVDIVHQFNKQQMREQIADVRIETMETLPTIDSGHWVPAEKYLLRSARGWRAHMPTTSHVTVRLFSRNLAPLPAPSERMVTRTAPAPRVMVAPPLAPYLCEPPTEEPVVPPPQCEVLQRPVQEESVPQELSEMTSALPPVDMDVAVAAHNKHSAAPPHPSPGITRKRRRTNEEDHAAASRIEEMSGEKQQQSELGETERTSLSQMLESTGLRKSRLEREQCASNSSETPLGSLDRTLVSLGDPVPPSESTLFLRENWGPEGTILKIIGALRTGQRPLTVERLVSLGPERPEGVGRAAVVAHCFGSILKLKQARFLKVIKNPETLEVVDMDYGDKIKLN